MADDVTAPPPAFVSVPEDWTPEQLERFEREWDTLTGSDLAARYELRIMPLGPQQMIVLHFWWQDGSTARQETYGPWPVEHDDAHLERIRGFLRDWRGVTGCEPSSVTMALVLDPAGWLAKRAAEGKP